MTESSRILKKPSLIDALIPVVFLITMLFSSVFIFDDPSGTNQVILILAAAVAALIGIKNGHTWREIESGMIETIRTSLQALLILLMVGSLIGSWILCRHGSHHDLLRSGQMMSPDYFYVTACLVCALLGFSIGSSWTVAGYPWGRFDGHRRCIGLVARDQCWRYYLRRLLWRQTLSPF